MLPAATKRNWISRVGGAWHRARQASATTAALRATVHDFVHKAHDGSREDHLAQAIDWLCRAQDACPAGGVSYGYDLREGWLPAYPETTGYIIPTLLAYAARGGNPGTLSDDQLHRRAFALAHWLIGVQMDSGAISSGTVGTNPRVPTVFNTGQVLEGWCAAWSKAPDPSIRSAIERAVRWLLSTQDSDGCWRKGLSPLTPNTPATYNVRTAAVLHDAGELFDQKAWRAAAVRNADWVLTQQQENGWFANNCVSDNEQPLTHAIGYTLEGLLRIGVAAGTRRHVRAVESATRRLMENVAADGFISGRFDAEWRPAARWNCLTGASQLSMVWFRLAAVTTERVYSNTARLVLDFVCGAQGASPPGSPIAGGIKGSHPIWGGYEPYRFPNWSAKFFADALMSCPAARTA